MGIALFDSDMLNLKDHINRDGKEYLVSTVRVRGASHRFETMRFPACEGKVTDWLEVYVQRADTMEEAKQIHRQTVVTWQPSDKQGEQP